jgi:hypothetical protein
MGHVREMIITLRGGIPDECDFCDMEAPPDLLHPYGSQLWICIDCVEMWEKCDAEIRTGKF